MGEGFQLLARALAELGVPEAQAETIVSFARRHARAGEVDRAKKTASVAVEVGTVARVFHRHSLRRSEILGHAIDDPSWNMLLALFADTQEGQVSSVTSLTAASGSPHATALRYLSVMEQAGLITRREDHRDKRRVLISATSSAMQRMNDMILSFCVPPPMA